MNLNDPIEVVIARVPAGTNGFQTKPHRRQGKHRCTALLAMRYRLGEAGFPTTIGLYTDEIALVEAVKELTKR